MIANNAATVRHTRLLGGYATLILLIVTFVFHLVHFARATYPSATQSLFLDTRFLSLCVLAYIISYLSIVLLHFVTTGSMTIGRSWNVGIAIGATLFVLLPGIGPARHLAVLVPVIFVNAYLSPWRYPVLANLVPGVAYTVRSTNGDLDTFLLLFWTVFVLIHFALHMHSELLIRFGHQEAELKQARLAATRFATANLNIQTRVYHTERSMVVRERSRIAHEIHDTVGHALTAALYQLRSLRRKVRTGSAGSHETLFDETERIVADALAEMRREVYCLNEVETVVLQWPIRWRKLCTVFAECTGIQVFLRFPDEVDTIDGEIGEAVFRIIQEALTNAIRHGGATYVDVSMMYIRASRNLLLRISDNGVGAREVKAGLGLTGILERAKSIGAEVAWQTEPNRGFDLGVEVRLPES